MQIVSDDLLGQDIASFLQEHIDDMRATSPPESKHALDLEGLKNKDISFWSIYCQDRLVGCGALKELDKSHGEIKSMRTSSKVRGQGIASKMLHHIIAVAKKRGYKKLSLETGSMDFFIPARTLYLKNGFKVCSPFANYQADPNSVFMSLNLETQ